MTEATEKRAAKKPAKSPAGNGGEATKPVESNGSSNGHFKALPAPAQEPGTVWIVELLPVDDIGPSPFQPRQNFPEDEMLELAGTVKQHGVSQPIMVRTAKPREDVVAMEGGSGSENPSAPSATSVIEPAPKGYELVAGERRLRASAMAKLKTIPAIVRDDLSDEAAAELALIENVQRSSLNPIEEANGYRTLMLKFRMREQRIAKKVGKSVQAIKDLIRLLTLPLEVQKLIATRMLTPSHGQHLLRLAPFEPVCVATANHASDGGMTAGMLSINLLPDARLLERRGLVQPLDYRTQFNWRETCGECHKAYVLSGGNAYCLKPDEWRRKNEEARELKAQEAARILEAARAKGKTTVDTAALQRSGYSDLRHVTLPSTCTGACPCRGESEDPDEPTRTIPICLNPARLNELKAAECEAQHEARGLQLAGLFLDAGKVLKDEADNGHLDTCIVVLCRAVLEGEYDMEVGREEWMSHVSRVSERHGIELPWSSIIKPDPDAQGTRTRLQDIEPAKLLLVSASLLLSQEARQALDYEADTPLLDFVLGREPSQPELGDDWDASTPGLQRPMALGCEVTTLINEDPAEDEAFPSDPFGDGVPEDKDESEARENPWPEADESVRPTFEEEQALAA